MSLRALTLLFLGACLLGAAPSVWGQDTPASFSMELPVQANEATPSWLGHPETPATAFATLNLPIQPPDSSSALLVTLYFQEKADGFLRLVWTGPQGAQCLSENFYEGINMSNQRSLLVASSVLQGGGTLSLQASGTNLSVQRIRFQWLQPRGGLVGAAVDDLVVTSAPGVSLPAQTLDGQPEAASGGSWAGKVVNLPLTDAPQRIEEGVDFSVDLDTPASAGRVVLKENGLPWGQDIVVWINGHRVGSISPAVPDLADTGFPEDAASSAVYVGWRDGSLFIPASFLQSGVNTVQFSAENDGDTSAGNGSGSRLPLALKDVVLQLSYPTASDDSSPSQASAASPVAAPSETSASPQEVPDTDLSVPGAYAEQASNPTTTNQQTP